MKYVISINLDRGVNEIFLNEVKEAIEKVTEFRCVKNKNDNDAVLSIEGNKIATIEAYDKCSVDMREKVLLVELLAIIEGTKILLSVEEVIYRELLCKTKNFDL